MNDSLSGKRIVLISGGLPPTPGGVADHTGGLITHLLAAGAIVGVLTSCDESLKSRSQFPDVEFVGPASPEWGIREVSRWIESILSFRPDLVWIQWVPFLYQRRGLNLSIPLLARGLKKRGASVITYSHELWVPYDRPAFFLSGPIQRLALRILIQFSAHTFVTIEPWVHLLKMKFRRYAERISWLPISSNIPMVLLSPEERNLLRIKITGAAEKIIIAVFSPFGSGKDFKGMGYLIESLVGSSRFHFLILGASKEECGRMFTNGLIPGNVTILGYLDAESVSRAFLASDLGLASFTDGISARRTSALALLQHGLPTLTTSGQWTDSCFLREYPKAWIWSIECPPAPTDFTLRMEEILSNKSANAELARKFYDRYFSWSKSFDRIKGVLEVRLGPKAS